MRGPDCAAMAPWGLIAFIIGIAYGFLAHGKQDKSELFKKGLLIGLVVGIILAVVGFLAKAPVFGVGGFLAVVWGAFIITLLFILGVWLGDLLEPKTRRR
jgi:hypothetical protein